MIRLQLPVYTKFNSPHLTQRSCFSTSGITMLNAANACGSDVCVCSQFDPWENVRGFLFSVILTDLKLFGEDFLAGRKNARSTSDRLFGTEVWLLLSLTETLPNQGHASPTSPRLGIHTLVCTSHTIQIFLEIAVAISAREERAEERVVTFSRRNFVPPNLNLWSISRKESLESQQKHALRNRFLRTLLCSNDIFNPGYNRKMLMRKRLSVFDEIYFNYEQLFHPIQCTP